MIEAYTIGIRLAVDDGVSSHIRAIRQDLTMINRAVDTSGTRIRDLVRLGRELVVPEQPAQGDTHRENIAPVAEERTIGGADRRHSALSGEIDQGYDGEHATQGEQTASRVASAPVVALAPQPHNRPAVPAAPRDDSRPAQPAAPINANRAPETAGRSVPDHQLTNLADLGRAISPAKASVQPTSTSRPMIETSRDWLPGRATITPASPTENQIHHAPDTTARPLTTSPPGALAAPPPPMWNVTIPSSEPVRQPGSIAPVGFLVSPPREMPAQVQFPSIAPAGRAAFASGETIPALQVSGNAAEPGRTEPSAPQDPAHGQLVIDGLAIGRWISDHLADRVVRPHSGFSGMDPRLSPAWPGVVSSG